MSIIFDSLFAFCRDDPNTFSVETKTRFKTLSAETERDIQYQFQDDTEA